MSDIDYKDWLRDMLNALTKSLFGQAANFVETMPLVKGTVSLTGYVAELTQLTVLQAVKGTLSLFGKDMGLSSGSGGIASVNHIARVTSIC